MTNKEFYREFGNIDSKMIEAAAPAEKVQKKKKNGWVKWASLAACLCLILVGSITYFMGNSTPEIPYANYPGYTATSLFYYDGDVCDSEIASITHKGFDDTSITLSIDKKTNDQLVVAFRGWKSSNSEVITNTAADLIIYVNGEKVDAIPTAPGIYEVRIDYSKFALKCDEVDPYMFVSDVGYFSLNNEGYKIDGFDGLPDLTMPE